MPVQISDNKTSIVPPPQPEAVMDLNIEKLGAAHLGGGVITEISKTATEQAELFDSEHSNDSHSHSEDDPRLRRDHASLSEQSKLYQLTQEELKKLGKIWSLEMELKTWEAFFNWIPMPGGILTEELKKLELLYQALQSAILNNTTGQAQVYQLERLDAALSSALNRLWDSSIRGFVSFLDKFGSKEDIQSLKSSLYQTVTGHTLSAKEMEQFWSEKHRSNPSRPNTFTVNPAIRQEHPDSLASDKLSVQGMIYHPAEKGKITANQQFNAQLQTNQGKLERPQSGAFMMDRNGQLLSAGHGKDTKPLFSANSYGLYSTADIQKTADFVRYIEHEGNLFTKEKLDAPNEELMGVLASVMSLKSQVYAAYSGISVSMGITVRSSVDKLIDYYLHRAEKYTKSMEDSSKSGGKSHSPLNLKAIYKVYYYVNGLYQKHGQPGTAISEGIQYAWDIFYQKKSDPGYQKVSRYSEEAEFYFGQAPGFKLQDKNRMMAEQKAGRKILEHDWNDFMKSVDKKYGKDQSLLLMEQSPWGMLIKPESHQHHINRKSLQMMLFSFLGLVILVIIYVWLRA